MLLLLALTAALDAAPNLLPNADFEREFTPATGLAVGWEDNSRTWADVDVEYARETANPHGGAACQRITCTRLGSGAIQFVPATGVPLRRGAIYRVRAWLRGDVGAVAVQLRLAPAPYTIYVEQSLSVGPTWQEVSAFWTSTVADPNARLMLRFTREGTLWLDDLAVEELSAEDAARHAPPAPLGNLLPNGRFELGLAHWLTGHGCDAWREAGLASADEGGNPCLRLTVPAGVSVTLSSEAVPLVAGRPVAVSCRLRADAATAVSLTSGYCGTRAEVSTAWQAVRATGTVGFRPQVCESVRLGVTGPAVLWIDDMQLRQDGGDSATDGVAAAVSVDRHPRSLYHDGEPIRLRLLSACPDGAKAAEIAWTVRDFWGQARLSGRWLPPGPGRQETELPAAALGRGWFHAEAAWVDGAGRPARSECAFAVLPPPERLSPVTASPFGAHFAVDPSGLALARAVGVRWLRLHPPNHTKWRIVEPRQKGEWLWRDEPIRIARAAGLELIGSLDRCPNWASSAPAGTPDDGFYTGVGAWLPRDWGEWEAYVAATVERHKSDIRIWEVWNEPDLGDWLIPRPGQSQAQGYLELLQHTYPVVKRLDPHATVIGGVVAGALAANGTGWRFAQELIALGGLQSMDVFSFHQYITRSVDEGLEPIEVSLARLRQAMRAVGRELPIVNSEGGYSNPGTCLTSRPCPADTIPPDRMARWLVRQYVAQLACGVRQFFFYNFFINGSAVTNAWEGFVEGDGQPRPNVPAYAAMTWLLDGAEFERTEKPEPNVWVHRFRTPQGPLAVTWTQSGTTATLAFPAAMAAWDLMGAPLRLPEAKQFALSDAPVYLRLQAGDKAHMTPEAPFERVVGPVGSQNPRNSEAAIAPLTDGSLLLGWTEFYAGSGADHGPARLVGRRSRDGGRTWDEKTTLVDNDGGCNVMEVNFLRLKDGRLTLFYCQKNSESADCRVMQRTSADDGRTWSAATQLSPVGKYTGLTNGRAIRLRSGRILLEAWEGGDSYCCLSDDEGATWRDSQRVRPAKGECWEPACVELKDGRVLMLLRTQLGGQYKSLSTDGGETWTVPVPTALVGTAAPVAVSRVPTTGDLLAIWNHNPGAGKRNPLTAAVSTDEGETWTRFRNLEDAPDDAWAYPAVTWVGDLALITYFNYKGGLSLKLRGVPASWFYSG
jgi:hypothetical protein